MSQHVKKTSEQRNILRASRLIGGGVMAVAILWALVSSLQSPLPATIADSTHSVTVEQLPPAPIIGHPAPEFTLATLDGQKLSLGDFDGPIILNFWASWCGPCRLEMPHLQEAHRLYGADIMILGVNLTNREVALEDVQRFVDEFDVTFPVALDVSGDVAALYEVRGQPASIFIDAAGTIQTTFYGPVNQQFIDARIKELLVP